MSENKRRIIRTDHNPVTNEITFTRADGSTGTSKGTAEDSVKLLVESQHEIQQTEHRYSLSGGYSGERITQARGINKSQDKIVGGGYSPTKIDSLRNQANSDTTLGDEVKKLDQNKNKKQNVT